MFCLTHIALLGKGSTHLLSAASCAHLSTAELQGRGLEKGDGWWDDMSLAITANACRTGGGGCHWHVHGWY